MIWNLADQRPRCDLRTGRESSSAAAVSQRHAGELSRTADGASPPPARGNALRTDGWLLRHGYRTEVDSCRAVQVAS
jgi:hypothetical protein